MTLCGWDVGEIGTLWKFRVRHGGQNQQYGTKGVLATSTQLERPVCQSHKTQSNKVGRAKLGKATATYRRKRQHDMVSDATSHRAPPTKGFSPNSNPHDDLVCTFPLSPPIHRIRLAKCNIHLHILPNLLRPRKNMLIAGPRLGPPARPLPIANLRPKRVERVLLLVALRFARVPRRPVAVLLVG
jgi:hypothetical protein